jgi:hypothetical protein
MEMRFKETKLTRQKCEVVAALDELPNGSGHISVDVVDPQGEVGHICVFRNRNGKLCARHGTPDPDNLYRKLKRSKTLKTITLAVYPVQPAPL